MTIQAILFTNDSEDYLSVAEGLFTKRGFDVLVIPHQGIRPYILIYNGVVMAIFNKQPNTDLDPELFQILSEGKVFTPISKEETKYGAFLATPSQKTKPIDTKTLCKRIAESFNKSELRALIFDLEIDHEDIEKASKKEMVRELVMYYKRRGLLQVLVKNCRQRRPNLSWH